jgi:hypothetical protein
VAVAVGSSGSGSWLARVPPWDGESGGRGACPRERRPSRGLRSNRCVHGVTRACSNRASQRRARVGLKTDPGGAVAWVQLSLSLFVSFSVFLSLSLFVSLSLSFSLSLSVSLFVSLSLCLSLSLYRYLSVSLNLPPPFPLPRYPSSSSRSSSPALVLQSPTRPLTGALPAQGGVPSDAAPKRLGGLDPLQAAPFPRIGQQRRQAGPAA